MNVVAAEGEIVPAPVKVMPRFALRVKLAVVTKLPPLNVRFVALKLPGTAPKSVSAEILTVPLLKSVPPL